MFNSNSKIISFILLSIIFINIVLPAGIIFYPKKAEACMSDCIGGAGQWVQNAWEVVADTVENTQSGIRTFLKQYETQEAWWTKALKAAMTAARKQILKMITNDIVNWIQGGGKPRFMTNPGKLLEDAADAAGGQFINSLSGLNMCGNFAPRIQFLFGIPSVKKFDESVKCKFSDAVNNVQNFAQNFNNGGWENWIKLSTTNSDFYSVAIQTSIEKSRKESGAEEASRIESLSGSGFLGPKLCFEYTDPKDSNPAQKYTDDNGMSEEEVADYGFVCTRWETQTPGAVASAMTSKALGVDVDWLINNEFVDAILTAAMNRVLTEGLATMRGGTGFSTTSYYGSYNFKQEGVGLLPTVDSNQMSQTRFLISESATANALLSDYSALQGQANVVKNIIAQKEEILTIYANTAETEKDIMATLSDYYDYESCAIPGYASENIASENITYTPSNCENSPSTCDKISTEKEIEINAQNIGEALVSQLIVKTKDNSLLSSQWITVIDTILKSSVSSTKKSGVIDKTQSDIDFLNKMKANVGPASAAISQYKQTLETYNFSIGLPNEQQARNAAITTRSDAIIKAGNVVSMPIDNPSAIGLDTIESITKSAINELTNDYSNDRQKMGTNNSLVGAQNNGTLYGDYFDKQKKLEESKDGLSLCQNQNQNQ